MGDLAALAALVAVAAFALFIVCCAMALLDEDVHWQSGQQAKPRSATKPEDAGR